MQWFPLYFCALYAVTVVLARVLWMRWRWGVSRESLTGARTHGRAWQMMLVFHSIVLTILGNSLLWGMGRLSAITLIQPTFWMEVVGCALMLTGWAVIVISQHQMGAAWRLGIVDEPTELQKRGIYRYVRHPIYTGMIMSTIGMLVMMPTYIMLTLTVLALIGLNREAQLEEAHLTRMHGDAYRHFSAQTGRWLPRWQHLFGPAPAITQQLLNTPAPVRRP
jgi:protein-S-isoprenylcysteine O-methyltransferase Ste14